MVEDSYKKSSKLEFFKRGFISGLGWSFGVTFGFLIISFLLIAVLRQLGGLPLVGNFIASIVEATISQLSIQTSIVR
ncbi:hypothetical protein A3A75_02600 [Candidatus Woesebacteria bacterium RIFCSPLOWO2_01_FULL_39_10]|uniref:Uncharacterized protein n=1 Tax=Candidatus Woesebacteria bacterium RIFCSPLOWO2_01_FULL_39_10 TaxID=1802516 RepID=A0A1F8B939_9BACT|nr:MAG: hypothetical protein A3A75_02600 [Candidatus Woesebacteria bacterium RIFCSPLOWO2_01_FULL_39_10]